MRSNIIRRAAVTTMIAAAALLLGSVSAVADAQTAAPATSGHAGAAASGYYFVAIDGAEARFYPSGEILQTYDTKADGHHTVTYYTPSNGGSSSLADYNGAGTHTSRNLSIPESGYITVNVCVAEGSTNLSCSGSVRFPARNP